MSPLRKLVPKLTWLIKFRRRFGFFAFFRGTVARLTYVALYAGFELTTMLDDIAKPKFITVGVARWPLLLPQKPAA
jgi:sulfoxide reductase heme-binding subunit YedZ